MDAPNTGSYTQFVTAVLAGANVLMNTILLWVVADLRARIHRLENLAMGRPQ